MVQKSGISYISYEMQPTHERMINMHNVVSYALAALAGVCFVTGLALLSDEGSAEHNGSHEETYINA